VFRALIECANLSGARSGIVIAAITGRLPSRPWTLVTSLALYLISGDTYGPGSTRSR